MAAQGNSQLSGRIAFTYPSFTVYQLARFFTVLATEMQSVAVGWQVYTITHRPLDLGLVGLAQFLPGIVMFLVSGHAADRYDRRKVLMVSYVGYGICSSLLLFITVRGVHSVYPIYAVMGLVGARSARPRAARFFHSSFPRSIFKAPSPGAPRFFRAQSWLAPRLAGLSTRLPEGPRLFTSARSAPR